MQGTITICPKLVLYLIIQKDVKKNIIKKHKINFKVLMKRYEYYMRMNIMVHAISFKRF